jgi:hypothetical protein
MRATAALPSAHIPKVSVESESKPSEDGEGVHLQRDLTCCLESRVEKVGSSSWNLSLQAN